MKRFSWIVTTIWVYLISILPFFFEDRTDPFWSKYFWIDSCLIGVIGYLFIFIKRRTRLEDAYIVFFISLKLFNLIYYIIGLILGKEQWMNANLSFLIIMAISAFIAFLFYKPWKEN